MTTVQIVGIAVAAAVVLLLVIALVVTRRRGRPEAPPPGTSFLDLSPQDTFDGLGRAEQPVEDVTLDAGAIRALRDGTAAGGAAAATVLSAPEPEEPSRMAAPVAAPSDDSLSPAPPVPAQTAPGGAPHDAVLPFAPHEAAPSAGPAEPASPVASWNDGQPGAGPEAQGGPQAFATTGHLSLDWGLEADPPDFVPAGGGSPEWDTDPFPRPPEVAPGTFDGVALTWTAVTGTDDGTTGDAAQPAPEPAAEPAPHKVPLADIMVTTSSKVIDLDDPEVRRMLTDLVKFEIDQATHYREQGQHLDAVLQLTEAEKISRALGMTESAHAIHLMMQELQR